ARVHRVSRDYVRGGAVELDPGVERVHVIALDAVLAVDQGDAVALAAGVGVDSVVDDGVGKVALDPGGRLADFAPPDEVAAGGELDADQAATGDAVDDGGVVPLGAEAGDAGAER